MPLQLRILRAITFLLFFLSVMSGLFCTLASFAPERIKVVDKGGVLIGFGIITRGDGILFWSWVLAVIFGLQFWIVLAMIRLWKSQAGMGN